MAAVSLSRADSRLDEDPPGSRHLRFIAAIVGGMEEHTIRAKFVALRAGVSLDVTERRGMKIRAARKIVAIDDPSAARETGSTVSNLDQ